MKPRQGHSVTNGSIILIDPAVSPPLFPVGPAIQCWDLRLQENDQYQPLFCALEVHVFSFSNNQCWDKLLFLFLLQSSKCQEDRLG